MGLLQLTGMKVGLDISQIAHGGGVATYTSKLAGLLAEDQNLETVFFYSSLRKPYVGSLPNVKSFKLPPSLLEILFNRLRVISIENFIGQIDIFHSSDWTQPKTRARKITTYHDVVPLKYPQWSHPKIVEVHKKRLEIVEKEIDCVIAVSESTKRDLIEVSGIPAEKIVVIFEAAGDQFKLYPEKDVEEFRKKYNLPDEFVLSIGGIGERRNLTRIKQAAQNYNLIITGETIPRLPDEEMPMLYNAAKVLMYPSFYEGFGLPILEAMSCGVPVITSNISAMPEVGGEAVLYANPEDEKDIADKLRLVMEDKKIRKDMIDKGFLQAKKFSWEKCAKETLEVYRRVIQE